MDVDEEIQDKSSMMSLNRLGLINNWKDIQSPETMLEPNKFK
jgi:hypothetical protein